MLKKILVILMSLTLLTGCDYDFIALPALPDDDNLPDVSFSAEVAPIFSSSGCIGCHNGGATSPDLRADKAYESIISLNLAIPGNTEGSIIYTYPHPVTGSHNVKYKSINDANTIYAWIKKGAENN